MLALRSRIAIYKTRIAIKKIGMTPHKQNTGETMRTRSPSSNDEEGPPPRLVAEAEAAGRLSRGVASPLQVLGSLRPLSLHQHPLVKVVVLEVP